MNSSKITTSLLCALCLFLSGGYFLQQSHIADLEHRLEAADKTIQNQLIVIDGLKKIEKYENNKDSLVFMPDF